ncbi:chromosome partitioning protein [Laceyella sacchari]|uniref:ParA family protein n=1 Tax=Laceyella sacchari TaxID=37482 RepID=UPI001045847E|nr:ParA family protein [Laceyella sacchari]TCW41603.1 chromosome partitioning protein [Laceyella sacchari]
MGHVISIGMGKGGVGKTTTCAVICDLLSERGYKVLGVDFDSQGNLTQMTTRQSLFDFEDRTILEAMKQGDPGPYIHEITKNFHIIPSDDYLALLSKFLYRDYEGHPFLLLSKTLNPIKDSYDYIIIDLPPNLGDHTLNGLAASDFALAIFQPEPFCFDGLLRYEETIELVQEEVNPNMKFLGIITSMMDSVATLDETIYQKAKRQYPNLLFDAVIKRRVKIKEYSITGLKKNTAADRITLKPYIALVKEMIERVQKETI